MVKIRPSIHKFNFIDWGWVRLGELAEVTGLGCSEVLRVYGYLSKDYEEHNVLAVTQGTEIINSDLGKLIEAVEFYEQRDNQDVAGAIYVPAGWAGDVIDEATGVNLRRRQERIDKATAATFDTLQQQGYSLWSYDEMDNVHEVSQTLAQIRERAKEAGLTIGEINAETDHILSSDPPPHSTFEVVFYDTSRFEMTAIYYGQRHFEEDAELGEEEWFAVTADGVHVGEQGSTYYLRQLEVPR